MTTRRALDRAVYAHAKPRADVDLTRRCEVDLPQQSPDALAAGIHAGRKWARRLATFRELDLAAQLESWLFTIPAPFFRGFVFGSIEVRRDLTSTRVTVAAEGGASEED